MSTEYRYTIEGEKLTRREIGERIKAMGTGFNAQRISSRLAAGKRTWSELAMSPEAAVKQAPRTFKQGMARGVAVIMERRRR